ncbi:hypothetical protein JR316_0005546 [Psilocybe cubensis]|uniref:Uncharacterized protein n=2 Tax=Psilocybe cubensis TaxID=181762 RepID=A0A8H7Y226_PSICU|nr:hypothetical protein JR316_0005546 [Psilocybe cubensis]KAH9481027.1 hypothetical protein JR316_0005546 [Psilocybe cubensis]
MAILTSSRIAISTAYYGKHEDAHYEYGLHDVPNRDSATSYVDWANDNLGIWKGGFRVAEYGRRDHVRAWKPWRWRSLGHTHFRLGLSGHGRRWETMECCNGVDSGLITGRLSVSNEFQAPLWRVERGRVKVHTDTMAHVQKTQKGA